MSQLAYDLTYSFHVKLPKTNYIKLTTTGASYVNPYKIRTS